MLVKNGGATPCEEALPLPWSLAATVFQLTPVARSLQRDEACNIAAFAASHLP